MTIKKKLLLSAAGLSSIIIFMFIATLSVSNKQKFDGVVINLAGRQRMLSQKMTKELITYQMKRKESGAGDQELADGIRSTIRVFDMTLSALKESGKAPVSLNLKTTGYAQCPRAEGDAYTQLGKVQGMWNIFKRRMASVVSGGVSAEDDLAWIIGNNVPLLKEMNKAVGILQTQSESNVSTLITLQVIGLLLGIAFMVFTFKTVAYTVGSIMDIVRVTGEIADGNLDQDVDDTRDDEIGRLNGAYGNLISSFKDMQGQVAHLANEAVRGALYARADDTGFKGDFQTLVKSINRVIGSLVGHLDAVPTPVMVVDKDLDIQYLNTSGAEMAGIPAEEATGKKCHEIFYTHDCAGDGCAAGRAMQEGKSITSDTTVTVNGTDREISHTGLPVYNLDGEVAGALEVIVDQTDIRKAMQAAEEAALDAEQAARTMKKISGYQAAEVVKLVAALNRFASGDLTVELHAEDGDADTAGTRENFIKISVALNRSVASLRTIVSDILRSSESVVSASEELSATSTQISMGAETQASSLEETSTAIAEMSATIQETARNVETQSSSVTQMAASVEEMSHSIGDVARNAGEVNGLAGEASKSALAGGEAVNKTVNGMNRINRSVEELSQAISGLGKRSEEIGNIVNTINDIAEQTNLLALNAAIEAARAGEHGKGFAVVADEVRKLAERSQMSTRDIGDLIKGIQSETEAAVKITEESTGSVEEGIALVNEAGDSIKAIIQTVDDTNKLAADISNATEQQARGSEQIVTAVTQVSKITDQVNTATEQQGIGSEEIVKAVESVNRITQQNSAAAGEMANATNQLAMLAEDLRGMVGAFRIDNAGVDETAAA